MTKAFPFRREAALLAVALLAACSGPRGRASGAPDGTAAAVSERAGAGVDAVPPMFKALGTEPFWSATFAPGTLTWSSPENPAGERVSARRIDQNGKAMVTAVVSGLSMRLEVHREVCSDGMSDVVYPLMVTLDLNGELRRGCAR